jgi:hypothetical protein
MTYNKTHVEGLNWRQNSEGITELGHSPSVSFTLDLTLDLDTTCIPHPDPSSPHSLHYLLQVIR